MYSYYSLSFTKITQPVVFNTPVDPYQAVDILLDTELTYLDSVVGYRMIDWNYSFLSFYRYDGWGSRAPRIYLNEFFGSMYRNLSGAQTVNGRLIFKDTSSKLLFKMSQDCVNGFKCWDDDFTSSLKFL